MPPKKKKVVAQKYERPGLIWRCAAIIALVGAFLNIIAAATASWVIYEPIEVNYALTRFTASQAKTQTYGKSWFGLYLVHFNGGTDVMPWFYRVSSICGASADLLAAQATQPIVSLWNNVCGVNCVGHFKTRCAAYKQVATIGYVTLAALIGGSCLAITASAWVFVFGKSRQFHRFSWFFAGAIALVLVSILFYSWIVFTNALSTLSWWPPWNTGPSLWTAVAGATLEICAAATVYGATVYERSQARKAKEQQAAQKALEEEEELEAGNYARPSMAGPSRASSARGSVVSRSPRF